jgi:hypothetical protein
MTAITPAISRGKYCAVADAAEPRQRKTGFFTAEDAEIAEQKIRNGVLAAKNAKGKKISRICRGGLFDVNGFHENPIAGAIDCSSVQIVEAIFSVKLQRSLVPFGDPG